MERLLHLRDIPINGSSRDIDCNYPCQLGTDADERYGIGERLDWCGQRCDDQNGSIQNLEPHCPLLCSAAIAALTASIGDSIGGILRMAKNRRLSLPSI